MDNPFVKPVAPAGKLDGFDLAPQSSVIDGQVLSDNWKAIMAKANGGVCFSDLNRLDASFKISEPTQAVLGAGFSTPLPANSGVHTHDGRNSAFLAPDCIGYDQIGSSLPELGVMSSNSCAFRGVFFQGSVPVPKVPSGSFTDTNKFALPYDDVAWGSVLIPNGAGGQSRFALQLRCPEGALAEADMNMIQLLVYVNVGGSSVSEVFARLDNNSGVDLNNVVVDWVCLCLL